MNDSSPSAGPALDPHLKSAASRLGLSYQEYADQRSRGLRWCSYCKEWHPIDNFGFDRHRRDNIAAECSLRTRGQPHPVEMPEKRRARRLVASRVSRGKLPHPSTLLCTDCDQEWKPGLPRHEYDHHHGYDIDHAADVEAVCQRCHNERKVQRGEALAANRLPHGNEIKPGYQEGAFKVAASRLGMTLLEYMDQRAAGRRWCCTCKRWQAIAEFGLARTATDGISRSCLQSRRERRQRLVKPQDI